MVRLVASVSAVHELPPPILHAGRPGRESMILTASPSMQGPQLMALPDLAGQRRQPHSYLMLIADRAPPFLPGAPRRRQRRFRCPSACTGRREIPCERGQVNQDTGRAHGVQSTGPTPRRQVPGIAEAGEHMPLAHASRPASSGCGTPVPDLPGFRQGRRMRPRLAAVGPPQASRSHLAAPAPQGGMTPRGIGRPSR